MFSWLEIGFIVLGLVVLVAFVALQHVQKQFVYQPNTPTRTLELFPKDMDIKEYEDVIIKSKDGTNLHCWLLFYPANGGDQERLPTCIFFHGNAGTMSYRLPNAHCLMSSLRCHVFILSYRGYGKSEGSPSEPGLQMDAQAAFDFVSRHPRTDPGKVFVFGRSLGGAVALALAANSKSRIPAVIVENTFTSVDEMRDRLFPSARCVWFLFALMRDNHWSNLRCVSTLPPSRSIMFICGKSDTVVPPWMSRLLFNTCVAEHKCLYEVEGGNHNDTWTKGSEKYFEAISVFLGEAFKKMGEAEHGRL